MAYFSSAMRVVGVCVCLLSSAGVLNAGLIDDGALDADHIALANLPQYDAVGVSFRNGSILDSSAVLIAPGWVLTAAHTEIARVPVPAIPNTFTVAGETRTIIDAIRHPSFTAIENGFDIALLQLDSPINSVTPAQLYTGTAASLLTQTLTYVGYGRAGTGSTGDTDPAGTKRAGKNVGDQLGFTLNPGLPEEEEYSDHLIFADMDDPPGGPQFGNPLGSTSPINLEYLIALGDSGGGLYVEDNGQHFLAGVHSVVFDFDPFVSNGGFLGYGDVMGSTTLEQSLAWILATIAPPPIVGDLNGDGFVGVDDLNIVLTNWNQNVTPGNLLMGDPTGEGFVGVDDLNIVLVNWNNGTPPPLGQTLEAVPEPFSATIFSLGAGVFALRPTRRQVR